GWAAYKVAGADPLDTHITAVSSTAHAKFGSRSALVEFDDPTYAGGIQTVIANSSTNAPLTITFSAYVYVPSDVLSSGVRLSVVDWNGTIHESEPAALASQWERLTITFAIP